MINNSKIIYSPEYDLLPRGFGVLHPFDVRKYSRAWKEVERFLLPDFKSHWIQPASTIAEAALLRVHTQQYLDSLANSTVVASIVEVALARFLPAIFLDKYLLQPMRYACEGTRLATQYALDGAMVMNMSGGYHHAFADHGEGFCVYADAAVAIADARARGLLHNTDKVIMIDLDAHRGNGFNSIADTENQVDVFDMYNFQAYPGLQQGNADMYPYRIPFKSQISDEAYLQILKTELPKFIYSAGAPRLAFYNAGTDILQGDHVGNLNVSYAGVVERDRYVLELLKSMNIPAVIMTSGGYTQQSFKLVANQAALLFESYRVSA